ncbi:MULTISPECIES: efflux RND transporter periplasmic adaptor subunit [Flavobacterium]|jgi:membrane fusion protein (multidrug efflux system)|uniref:Efflux transporter, RND family, MFP subunit n=1 Tax=Flavobacterium johnsoniae (strain ATCC 17061 / DSM 2064 / JCM 8514 / BCRC 14874 / CCUG 350202 / NBRC 14942 / NCIMB 11054 / UW101) TaxID=376686 RepID=A5FCD4_FLAJ1|nr:MULTISPECIES: efflux RND transporter periplasmic adaptor subunit [Flavobacterium]ABQ07140.1 efflux transporter, RND family, MFP subunit [Flavobacterium johnsoniae UW101]OXE98855.1 efflux transporter periplasmic adaptor subunit [Flavobacterium johnsoniae UW101]WDF57868.1 efflux RND transporter periplasmic adaptor subunit [Flavobacterium sp. KACC 22758]WQG81021.1 efflux RND transporter periplasmic adaptor subunit [Flavobacterium johnsoniae UW101]SHL29207.1 membrane fusion protein, multidrug e
MNKQSFLSILAASVIIASCGKNDKSAQAGGAPQVKEYKTLTLQPESATLNSDYPASIQGQQNIEIRPRVEGYIDKIFVDEGAVVKAGQPLFKISAPEYEQQVRTATASIKSAQADLSSAKLAVNKVKPLVEKGIISKYDLESAQYTYESALASLAQANAALVNAKTNLGYTTVTSPVNGVVGSIPFRLGSLVSSNTAEPLTTVSSIGNVYAYFALNEKALLNFTKDSGASLNQKLKSMPAVSLLLSDGSAYDQKGNIETVNGLINTETGTVNVRARFPNPKGIIRSGSSTTVRIPKEVKDGIIVPQSATFELQDKMFAVVLGKDGKTRNANITVLENTAGNYYVVTSGLKPGDEIVLEGVASLKEGSEIKAKKQSPETVYADLK